jgi:hypothetical protein
MSKYSFFGILFGLLYIFLGIGVVVAELGPSGQLGGLFYLLYLIPWSFFLWDPWISDENIFVMLIATTLNTLALYF